MNPFLSSIALDYNQPIYEDNVSSITENEKTAAFFMNNNFALIGFNQSYSALIERYSPFPSINTKGIKYFDLLHWTSDSRSYLEKVLMTAKRSKMIQPTPKLTLHIAYNGSILETLWDGCVFPVINRAGSMRGFLVICEDLTEQQNLREQQKRNNTRIVCNREIETLSKRMSKIEQTIDAFAIDISKSCNPYESEIISNINSLILPNIAQMKRMQLTSEAKSLLNVIESTIHRITAPFSNRLASKHYNLTPKEIQIANLITHGNSSKEISNLLNISLATVDTHRNNIRKKLKLNNKKKNLNIQLVKIENH